MKRTIEIILSSVGTLFTLIGLIGTAVLVFFGNSDLVRESFVEGFEEGAMDAGGTYNPGEADMLLNFMIGFGWIVFIALLIAFVLGIISIFFYVGNKKPKAASIIAIVTGVVVGLGTMFTGFLPALLFVIAGIIGLVRKPPVNPEVTEA